MRCQRHTIIGPFTDGTYWCTIRETDSYWPEKDPVLITGDHAAQAWEVGQMLGGN